MQINNISDEQVMIVKMSCYLKKDEIFKNIERYGYQSSDIKKINPPFPLNILPVPKPYYFYLYDTHLNQIYDLAWSCNDFLMFEIFILDRERYKDCCGNRQCMAFFGRGLSDFNKWKVLCG